MSSLSLKHNYGTEVTTWINELSQTIESNDDAVKKTLTDLMGTQVLGFLVQDTIKYAIAPQKGYITFHNMVMYCYPELKVKFEDLFPKEKFLKSCLHFRYPLQIDRQNFSTMIKLSAEMPFPKPR